MKILIVGCSFSEDINLDNVTSWSYRLRDYLKSSDYEVTNLSESGQGNGVISDLVIDYVSNNQIDLVLIQWSAFTRIFKIVPTSKHWNKYKNLDWESGDVDKLDLLTFESTYNSLNAIINIQEFLNKNNIKYKMWFGWQQVYPEQIEHFQLTHLIDIINEDENFILFHQKETWDNELKNYGLFTKSNYATTLLKLFGLSKGENYYPETKWGGMSEYIRMNLNKNRYISETDSHPSSEGHRVFFEGVIKPMFQNVNTDKKII